MPECKLKDSKINIRKAQYFRGIIKENKEKIAMTPLYELIIKHAKKELIRMGVEVDDV